MSAAARSECAKLLKPGYQTAPPRRCLRRADTQIVAVGPAGEVVDHGRRCRQHARMAVDTFALRSGWSVELRERS